MASKDVKLTKKQSQYLMQYKYDISNAVIDKFGGSYQNYETLCKTWRQQMDYRPEIEEFILSNNDIVLVKALPDYAVRDLNCMYGLCNGIAEYLSKYMIKKSVGLTRATVQDEVVNRIFFNSPVFIKHFQARYKKPLDLDNEAWVNANPGVVAMAAALKAKSK